MRGSVAIVLHAHLPYVRHPQHERPLEERWLHEAIWESYLPLLEAIWRLRESGIAPRLTISISPTLAAMLTDPLLQRRFEQHLAAIDRLAASQAARSPVLAFYRERLASVRAAWERVEGDVLRAFVRERESGGVELWTTAATHAYLPGLLVSMPSLRAQIRLGLLAFERLTGVKPIGFWLPECAYDPRIDRELAAAGVKLTVLDAHGLELARPAPPLGVAMPVLSPNGVAYFGRDPNASRDVWSRQGGYPGDPAYREFYRDLGFDLSIEELGGEVGPFETRVMTGLKVHRITGRAERKEPYDRDRALAKAREHAAMFLHARGEDLAKHPESLGPRRLVVAPFDAELFGHWWFEGPDFLEQLLRELHASALSGGLEALTLGDYLARFPEAPIVEPAASSWGEGGFGEVWAGPEAARLWRHVHHAERMVTSALEKHRAAEGLAGRALDQAIREVLLLEASDWAFMLRRGEMTAYAEARVRAHAHRAVRLAAIAGHPDAKVTVDEVAFVHAAADEDRFLGSLSGDALRSAFS